ncbi:DUF2750 domain-containing protein [Flaviaesturariibacter aridisoli]|uniref:DUF2750 domain-containing protein n=1 Tax=Flaviaesturariibacter aridisoli TaxID=2545761 RepID=A0A4R4DT51_9BACT|nr:DUF2750 domain-containing protein [Flaviaesturariibacter aridisoli]TCZ64719.1 DUF2750 domain-containing protein [Flaviaesturariibacter aridisoli]
MNFEQHSEQFEQHSEDQHRLFIAQAAESGSVWALRSDEGFAVSPSNEYDEAEVIPFWSNPEGARSLATDEWEAYAAVEIPLSEFLETWMLGMQSEELLVGTNWDAELAGTELEPIELAYVLTTRLLEQGKTIELEHFDSLQHFHEQLKAALEDSDGKDEA